MCSSLSEGSLQDPFQKEITSFLKETAIGERPVDFFEIWRVNREQYPSFALSSPDLLAVQVLSVSREVRFSINWMMISVLQDRHLDKLISSPMLLQSWNRPKASLNTNKINKLRHVWRASLLNFFQVKFSRWFHDPGLYWITNIAGGLAGSFPNKSSLRLRSALQYRSLRNLRYNDFIGLA